MTSRVTLISPALTAALREARFDDGGCELDAAGERLARSAAARLPDADRSAASPSARCRRTAEALGLSAPQVPALAALDVGRWRGRTLAEVTSAEPDAVASWLVDPAHAPHGGESVRDLCDRVGAWLDGIARTAGRVIAVVEPDVVRALLVRGLSLPEPSFWRLDVRPLTAVDLSGRAGRWNLQVGTPLGEAP
ncbi:histidine phosphatase family protein [Streptomyces sp. NBC_00377]|uniref:histidine phosphatase family protein n=1 Tax=unclassified Streptomyces TaxID=2593676 RepID=UPI002E1BA59A|nr:MULTISPECIES: histidine phosphatase family protein [unclassified Streptomyces]